MVRKSFVSQSLGAVSAILLLAAATGVNAAEIEFGRDIRPILSDKCFACHGPDEKTRVGGLRLDEEASAKQERNGRVGVVPGDLGKSEVWKRIEHENAALRMPPSYAAKQLTADEKGLLREWIEQGAPGGDVQMQKPIAWQPIPETVRTIYKLYRKHGSSKIVKEEADRHGLFAMAGALRSRRCTAALEKCRNCMERQQP